MTFSFCIVCTRAPDTLILKWYVHSSWKTAWQNSMLWPTKCCNESELSPIIEFGRLSVCSHSKCTDVFLGMLLFNLSHSTMPSLWLNCIMKYESHILTSVCNIHQSYLFLKVSGLNFMSKLVSWGSVVSLCNTEYDII